VDRSTFAASTIDIETKKMTKEGVYEPLETFLDEFYKEKEKREIEDYQLDKKKYALNVGRQNAYYLLLIK